MSTSWEASLDAPFALFLANCSGVKLATPRPPGVVLFFLAPPAAPASESSEARLTPVPSPAPASGGDLASGLSARWSPAKGIAAPVLTAAATIRVGQQDGCQSASCLSHSVGATFASSHCLTVGPPQSSPDRANSNQDRRNAGRQQRKQAPPGRAGDRQAGRQAGRHKGRAATKGRSRLCYRAWTRGCGLVHGWME
jgi:hypothetical protein